MQAKYNLRYVIKIVDSEKVLDYFVRVSSFSI